MSEPDAHIDPREVKFDSLLRYNEQETAHWREWFGKHPDAVLQIPAGDSSLGMGTLRDLLFHIQIVEWVYAKVLHGESWEGEWQKLDRATLGGIFAIGAEAQPKLRAFADSATGEQLARRYKLTAGSGQTVAGSGRKFLTHVLLHSLRHWAQVAMLLRQQGYATDWQHDFIFCDALD